MTDSTFALLAAVADPQASRSALSVLLDWANVQTGWQLALVIFGFIAQAMFFGRWLVQWISTEKRRESHIPDAFWWMSLAGASMLFVYFTLRGEPVGMIGQSVGWTVYTRNLYLIYKKRRSAIPPDYADPGRTEGGG